MDKTGERTVKLPSFDGKSKSFMVWWVRFRAYATVHKFVKALQTKDEVDLPAKENEELHEAEDDDLKKIAARSRNAVAMANCAMAFTCETTLGIIFKAISADWPTGKSSRVTDLFLKKYKPEDIMPRVELRQELNKIKLKKNPDPSGLFEQISTVQNRYNNETNERLYMFVGLGRGFWTIMGRCVGIVEIVVAVVVSIKAVVTSELFIVQL